MSKVIGVLLVLALFVFIVVFSVSTIKELIVYYKKRKEKKEVRKDNDGSIK